MRRPGTYTSELSSRACSGWQPQKQRSLPAQGPQQYQRPSLSHDTLESGQPQREQVPEGALPVEFTDSGIGYRRRFLNPVLPYTHAR